MPSKNENFIISDCLKKGKWIRCRKLQYYLSKKMNQKLSVQAYYEKHLSKET